MATKKSWKTALQASESKDKRLQNLMPIEEVNARKTREERRESASKAGKESVKKRKRQKTAKEELKMLLSLPVTNDKSKEALRALGIDPDEANNRTMVVVSAYRNALKGDPKSIQMVLNNFGMSEAEKENIKLKKEALKIEREESRVKIQQIVGEQSNDPEYRGIPSLSIIPAYASLLRDIKAHRHSEYILSGGRGSTKSSFISLVIVDLIETNREFNACVFREVGNTIQGSVYNQIVWAIDQLGLNDEYKLTKSPAEITKLSTGQKIFFRGADDPLKVKSIKPLTGYLAIAWFEELDQFNGPESIRNIEQSVIRGGDIAYKFKSFNPPKSRNNWANEYALLPKGDMIVTHTSYLDVPEEFLGKAFIDDAEFLKTINPNAYEHEYLGIANGNGGNVFDNVEVREITGDEIAAFDRIYEGVDWGWYPDPFAFARMHYDASRMTLYIYGEFRANKMGNEETAKAVREKFDIRDSKGNMIQSVDDGIIYCDSAEPKSVGDWKALGMPARAVEKGPGSVDYSMKWLARLLKIVIDPVRCPETAKEFVNYEYDRDKDGNVVSGFPDRDNHSIDAVRYAMFPVWRKRGQ